jgi:hypothetical protein
MLELLNKLEYSQETDRIILLGDLISRGYAPIETITKIREQKLESVCGNHDLKLQNYLRSGKPEKHPEYYNKLLDDDKQYILNIPSYIELDNLICFHAGIKPNIPLQRQGTDLMYLRYTDKNRKFISLRDIAKYGVEKLGAHFWTEFGPFGKNIVYGHQVHSLKDIRIDTFTDETACYGIDTGVVFGGHLTALIWETKEIIQVKAKQEYFKPLF